MPVAWWVGHLVLRGTHARSSRGCKSPAAAATLARSNSDLHKKIQAGGHARADFRFPISVCSTFKKT